MLSAIPITVCTKVVYKHWFAFMLSTLPITVCTKVVYKHWFPFMLSTLPITVCTTGFLQLSVCNTVCYTCQHLLPQGISVTNLTHSPSHCINVYQHKPTIKGPLSLAVYSGQPVNVRHCECPRAPGHIGCGPIV